MRGGSTCLRAIQCELGNIIELRELRLKYNVVITCLMTLSQHLL
jgi:hypothetical protein